VFRSRAADLNRFALADFQTDSKLCTGQIMQAVGTNPRRCQVYRTEIKPVSISLNRWPPSVKQLTVAVVQERVMTSHETHGDGYKRKNVYTSHFWA
jgi:hypothetical protein